MKYLVRGEVLDRHLKNVACLSQRQFSKCACISPSYLTRLIQGKRCPDEGVRRMMLKASSMEHDQLFREYRPMNKRPKGKQRSASQPRINRPRHRRCSGNGNRAEDRTL